jgi:hypothetical protein
LKGNKVEFIEFCRRNESRILQAAKDFCVTTPKDCNDNINRTKIGTYHAKSLHSKFFNNFTIQEVDGYDAIWTIGGKKYKISLKSLIKAFQRQPKKGIKTLTSAPEIILSNKFPGSNKQSLQKEEDFDYLILFERGINSTRFGVASKQTIEKYKFEGASGRKIKINNSQWDFLSRQFSFRRDEKQINLIEQYNNLCDDLNYEVIFSVVDSDKIDICLEKIEKIKTVLIESKDRRFNEKNSIDPTQVSWW